jgi:SH3-like domain-containing protein
MELVLSPKKSSFRPCMLSALHSHFWFEVGSSDCRRRFFQMEKHLRQVRILVEHKIEYADPICVTAGERVSVGREDDEFPGWRWCKASDGREGWVPVELLSKQRGEATVLQDYSARELPVHPGEEVVVEEARHDWLLVRNARGERGWIPASHVETRSVSD